MIHQVEGLIGKGHVIHVATDKSYAVRNRLNRKPFYKEIKEPFLYIKQGYVELEVTKQHSRITAAATRLKQLVTWLRVFEYYLDERLEPDSVLEKRVTLKVLRPRVIFRGSYQVEHHPIHQDLFVGGCTPQRNEMLIVTATRSRSHLTIDARFSMMLNFSTKDISHL